MENKKNNEPLYEGLTDYEIKYGFDYENPQKNFEEFKSCGMSVDAIATVIGQEIGKKYADFLTETNR